MDNNELLNAIDKLIDKKLDPITKKLDEVGHDVSSVRMEWESKRGIMNDLMTMGKENQIQLKKIENNISKINEKVSIHDLALNAR